jgi:translation elongation factor EF-4
MGNSTERLQNFFKTPFMPLDPAEADNAQQIAHAIEYAAAQLGVIARTTAKIEAHLAKIATRLPAPQSIPDAPPPGLP